MRHLFAGFDHRARGIVQVNLTLPLLTSGDYRDHHVGRSSISALVQCRHVDPD